MSRSIRRHAVAGALALAGIAIALNAPAALYKWVDANGRVVYSDQPPVGNFKTEVVGAAAPPSNPDAMKDLANREAEFKKRQADKVEDAKKGDKARADAQKLNDQCAQVRAHLANLKRSDYAVMYRINEKGERVAMDETAKKAEVDRLEQLIKERNCPPASG
jgi:hypothetical protein